MVAEAMRDSNFLYSVWLSQVVFALLYARHPPRIPPHAPSRIPNRRIPSLAFIFALCVWLSALIVSHSAARLGIGPILNIWPLSRIVSVSLARAVTLVEPPGLG